MADTVEPQLSPCSGVSAQTGSPKAATHGVTIAGALFAGFLLLYHLNGGFLAGNDAVPNIYLPVRLLTEGKLSFSPDDMPFMFTWTLKADKGQSIVRFDDWDQTADVALPVGLGPREDAAESPTWRELRGAGRLSLRQPEYYLVPSVDPANRGYVGQYGPGAGLAALPWFAVESLFVGDLAHNKAALWYGGKFSAAFCVAVSVAVVYLGLLRLPGPRESLVVAIAYGAGTCVWSVCSQTLWQSSPNVMFIALSAYCLLRIEESDWWAAGCAVAGACGTICRPTTALLVLTIGLYLAFLAVRRPCGKSLPAAARPLLIFVAAGLPFAAWLGWFNWYYLGSPLKFGQTEAGARIAAMKLGSADVWQGSFLEGLAGLLLSPSRGMLVFSPILAFAAWGALRAWREPRLHWLRPMGIATLLLLLVQAKWFDWHGGWSFGYRLMVDAMPLLALCGAGIAGQVWRRDGLRAVCAVAIIWSVGVQVVGAFAYDVTGWNNRKAYLVKLPDRDAPLLVLERATAAKYASAQNAQVRPIFLDVDQKGCRRRLWRLGDSQLLYYLTHWSEARSTRESLVESCLKPMPATAIPLPRG